MILLDYRDKRPIYEQMVDKLERLIASGGLEQGSKMPSVRSLAVELAVNPNTVQRAYTLLEQEGYLYTITGRGSFVAPEREWRDGQRRRVLAEWVAMTRKARDAGLAQQALGELLDQVYSRDTAEKEASRSQESPGKLEEASRSQESPGKLEEASRGQESPGKLEEVSRSQESPGKLEEASRSQESHGKLEEASRSQESPGKLKEASLSAGLSGKV